MITLPATYETHSPADVRAQWERAQAIWRQYVDVSVTPWRVVRVPIRNDVLQRDYYYTQNSPDPWRVGTPVHCVEGYVDDIGIGTDWKWAIRFRGDNPDLSRGPLGPWWHSVSTYRLGAVYQNGHLKVSPGEFCKGLRPIKIAGPPERTFRELTQPQEGLLKALLAGHLDAPELLLTCYGWTGAFGEKLERRGHSGRHNDEYRYPAPHPAIDPFRGPDAEKILCPPVDEYDRGLPNEFLTELSNAVPLYLMAGIAYALERENRFAARQITQRVFNLPSDVRTSVLQHCARLHPDLQGLFSSLAGYWYGKTRGPEWDTDGNHYRELNPHLRDPFPEELEEYAEINRRFDETKAMQLTLLTDFLKAL